MLRGRIRKRRIGATNDEGDSVQTPVAQYLDKIGVLWFHPANGGSRHVLEAVKLKRHGVKAGVPDIIVMEARKGYHGLQIELKRQKGGRVSPAQAEWLKRLTENGYLALVARGFDDALLIVQNYFK